MSNATRRKIVIASGVLLAAPLTAYAQPAQKVRRIGFLSNAVSGAEYAQTVRRQIVEFLKRAGYEDGRNLKIEWRYAEGRVERLAGFAEELVRLKVELIMAFQNDSIAAAKRATNTIPIVMGNSSLPVKRGFVESLSRPGGNITGTVWEDAAEASDKRFQLIKEAMPGAKRIANLWNPVINAPVWNDDRLREQDRSLAAIGITLIRFGVSRSEEIATALDKIAVSKADALYVGGEQPMVSHFGEIAAFALQRKLVSFSPHPAFPTFGGLLYYGADFADMIDKAASYVEKILSGAKPGDLAVQLPTKYEVVLNAKTARAIGFKPPPSFMVRVDRQVE